jgi:hypothetical protein
MPKHRTTRDEVTEIFMRGINARGLKRLSSSCLIESIIPVFIIFCVSLVCALLCFGSIGFTVLGATVTVFI